MLSKYSQVQFYFKDHVKRNIMVQSKFILDTQSKIYDFFSFDWWMGVGSVTTVFTHTKQPATQPGDLQKDNGIFRQPPKLPKASGKVAGRQRHVEGMNEGPELTFSMT